jgi:hypothetical protein
MNLKRAGVAFAMFGMVVAFFAGRWSVTPAEGRSADSQTNAASPAGPSSDSPLDYTGAWRVILREDSERAAGSTKAVNDLQSLHRAGKLLGSDGKDHRRELRFAREIRFLRDRIEFELLCMDKPDGHYALIDIELPTWRVIRAEFGEYPF